ncbi:MAG: heptosyltransferase [Acidobacteriota bacterium]|jgi:ADP-heptose:LPS heptosyltransferase
MAPHDVSSRLQIYDPRERALVSAADRTLAIAAGILKPFRPRRPPAAPARILLLRLERIGDLLMALPAIADVRALAPLARIDLVVGSWNADMARAVTAVSGVKVLNAGWLARGETGLGLPSLLRAAREWRQEHYDLGINFEPDIRSNLLLAVSGSSWTAGFTSGGGGAVLDAAIAYDPHTHTTDNARRLVGAVLGHTPAGETRGAILDIPASSHDVAAARLGEPDRPLVGMHVSGGRAIKQWPPARFAEVGRRLIETGATVVLTGSPADRVLIDQVTADLPPSGVIDVAAELGLVELAAILQRLDLLVTGDTGPMHLAAAVGTPVVAVFGPSDPARYAPTGPKDHIVRVDLPCSPCNRIRLPPARCIGHTPDCLSSISADRVLAAVMTVLATRLQAAGSSWPR